MSISLGQTGSESSDQIKNDYEAFFNTLDDFLFVFDHKGVIQHYNDAVIRRLGFAPEELIGQSVMLVHPEERQSEVAQIVEEMVNGTIKVCPIPLITKQGELIPVETSVVQGIWNNNPALFGICKDISRLTFSEEKFAKSFHFNPTPCGFSDLVTGKYVEVNDAVCELLEFSRDEMIGHTAAELGIISVEDAQRVLSQADENGKLINKRSCLTTKSGKLLNVLMSAENMFVADKQYRFTVVNNINESLEVQQLNEQYSRLQDLMIKISTTYINIELEKVDAVIEQSLREMAEFVNADRAYIFDYDFEKNVCNNLFEWCGEGISAEIDNLQNIPLDFIPNWIETHRRGEAFYMPDIYLLPNNGPYSVRGILEPQGVLSLITLPMKLNNELVGFVGFDSVRDFHVYSEKERDLLVVFSQMLVNIAERKRQADALILAKNEAIEASKTKEVFLATMSHEIRTPLNVITGMVREMLKQNLSAMQHSLLSNAKSAAVHLLSILNNILDLSKIEAGEFVLDNVVFDFENIARDAERIMILRAREKNLTLQIRIDPEMDTVFFGDEARIRQVIINLIDNSLKFTEVGTVVVKIWPAGLRDTFREVHVEVHDTGIGISPEFIGKMFTKFTQEESNSRRKYQGTGLGMNIVKQLVQLMGGDIEVTSEKGVGTRFHFYLLLKPARRELLPVPIALSGKAPDLTGKKVLVVEDNEMNRYVAHLSLQSLNCTILESENGEQAVELLKQEKVDLILMDIQMPVMDGIEATRIIRQELKLTMPIVALTANAFKQNVEQYLAAGLDDYIVKPYLELDFYQILNKYIPNTGVLTIGKPAISLYDIHHLREICKNEDSFMRNMIRIFVKLVAESIPQFEMMYAQEDFTGIRKLAHKLKPSIDNLSIVSITDKIRILEKADPLYMPPGEISVLIKDISEVLSTVAAELNSYLESLPEVR